ncbi:hypothetical protein MAPG_08832 [Magnaporthiopsis poae ATCC 64411]|uniref:Uncharacterized protein n=1 Tax=Magnaporthiopsis poae (strain ATCC 64411 / 73-15) TaxID=644358 RepID=A0A0C4E8D1_MAGP6|nr:hypothetical protein MAPG_08832 [Magnaporthiopsis poae ATCC 64411]
MSSVQGPVDSRPVQRVPSKTIRCHQPLSGKKRGTQEHGKQNNLYPPKPLAIKSAQTCLGRHHSSKAETLTNRPVARSYSRGFPHTPPSHMPVPGGILLPPYD